MSFSPVKNIHFYAPIEKNIELYKTQFDQIPDERKGALKRLALFIDETTRIGEKVELIFICTHNSRRSHISQIWAQTAAAYYGIPNVYCYSGGTEATAFNPRAVTAMKDAGFQIKTSVDGANPVYEIRFSDDADVISAFSKKYDADSNPRNGFGAVMTCSHADENCPVVVGAAIHVSTPYDDPKDFDGTAQEAAKYTERVHQIGRDIVYAFSLVKGK